MSDTQPDPSDWNRIKQIFHETRQASGPERERLLGVLCGDDATLRALVEELLAADDGEGAFLDAHTVERAGAAVRAAAEAAGSDPPESPGKHIGPYKLLQRIGEGGFGVVYMAEQEEPIRRRVALKVIKPGMDTKQVIARFEAERQALAMLDHPNIAKVFDAGSTPAGRPYFVMELVKGIPITDYCDEERLGARERLRLFADVCGALHHAHENGIIHRDIKPSNVLVTLHDGTPVPKVIDFGVAKAIRQKLTESTLFTEYNQFIGTPEYMAPEQAAYAGLDVDRRSDVYSLGTLLYELLTGTTPFEARALRRAAHLEVLRILKEEEPPKPSTRVHTMGKTSQPFARDRRTDPTALARLLRGDLDWIVMKALEKDRGRRYESASELAADIGRYFEQRPIVARPPSFGYKARKLLRRRRGPFAAAAVVALGLMGDAAYVGWQRSQRAGLTALPQGPVAGRSELLFTTDDHWCFFDPRPSPDGTRVAYLNICDNPGVYVVDNETGEAHLVSEADWHWGLAWSPDGTRIIAGHDEERHPRAKIIDLTTGAIQAPPALASLWLTPFQWSPDGARVSGLVNGADGNVTAAVVSLASGEVTSLAEGVRQGQAGPVFSPDGRYVAFGDAVDRNEDLFVVDLETGERWALTATSEVEGTVLWSPDGSHLAYVDDTGLWALPVSEGRPTGPPRLVRRGDLWPNAWLEHGFYYTLENSLTKGYRIPVDPQDGQVRGAWEPLEIPNPSLRNVRLAWAPDMSRFAVAGWSDGMIHLVEGERVTAYPVGLEVLPSNLWWSGDGKEVFYTSPERARRDRTKSTVMALDPSDGTTRSAFEPVEGLQGVHIAPDGHRMVFRVEEDGVPLRLVVSDLGSTEGRTIAASDEVWMLNRVFGQPLFSPTGEQIVYLRNDHDWSSMSLWVVAPDGTGERKLAEAHAIVEPHWDPTGRRIAFMTGYPSASLRVVDVGTGEIHEIEGFSELESARLMDWSSDGAWLAVRESIGRSELWRVPDLLGER